MAKEIDAKGLPCPQPVMLVSEAIDSGENEIIVEVDNETARENVARLAGNKGFQAKVDESPGRYSLTLTRSLPVSKGRTPASAKTVYFIRSNLLGQGDEQLGGALIKTFLYTLTEGKNCPDIIIFINSGVRLVSENDETIAHLQELEKKGVEILSCGTCLDFYNLKDNVRAGKVSNMYEIIEAISGADKTITV